MAPLRPVSLLQTIYRLGEWYSAYRLVLALSLNIIFALTLETVAQDYQHPDLYFYSIVGYALISCIQLIFYKILPFEISKQLILLFIVDVCCFSLLNFALGGPNLHLSLLFVVTVFAATILLRPQLALIITLVAVISVIYQQVVGSFFNSSHLNSISNSALLAFLFFVMYGIGQIAVQRFRLLENLNFYQSIELNQLQNINRAILEQIEVGYLVLDEQQQVILNNPAACSLLGIPPIFTDEKYFLRKLQPDLYTLIRFSDLKDGERFLFESQLSPFSVDIQVQKLLVPHQALTLLILQDAQKIKQQVQQLKLMALGQLSASIAHEIRNPLAAIVQANELLADSQPEQLQMLTGMIDRQSQRIDKIIYDTLNMARNSPTEPAKIRLSGFLAQVLNEDLIDIKQAVQLQIEQDIWIYFDELQLRQVLINLIRNALRHNSAEQPFIIIQVHGTEERGWIDVIDFGQGVAERDISQLFKPFFSTEINGTGLGLYLSHSFCEANHAKLTYVKQQQGACFRIECSIIY